MRKVFFTLAIFLMTVSSFANYLNSFSAAIQAWDRGEIDQSLSLTRLSLSSTVNVTDASKLWYFKARLNIMKGNTKDALEALQTAGGVFEQKPVFSLLNDLASASITTFSPVSNIKYVNSIEGFYGAEVFYTPLSVCMRRQNYYVLDGANHFVEEFGAQEVRHRIGVDSTPTFMIYSSQMDSFFISFENGSVYEYSPNFSQKKIFTSNLSHPVVSCTDNAGRVYIGEYGKDRVDVLGNDGTLIKKFNLFNKKVHLFSYVREFNSVAYVMDLTEKKVRKFDVISGKELPSVPFPKGSIPFTFELLGPNVIFINSHSVSIGGIQFPLSDSTSVFSSNVTGRILMTTDVVKDKVNLYNIETQKVLIFPIIDGLSFKEGKFRVKFRLLDPMGSEIENPSRILVKDNEFQQPVDISRIHEKVKIYEFPKLDDIVKMNQTSKNVVILRASSLKGHEKDFFSPIILNNVTLYLVVDEKPTDMERTLVCLSNGSLVSGSEIERVKDFSKNRNFFEFEASYSKGLPSGVDEVDLMYGPGSHLIDSVYYTMQNIIK